jgi:N-methylhydantoinase A
VCYDRGGSVPTVTDANVVLGFVNPEALAGGGLRIRRELAVRAIEESIARPLRLTVEEAAWGVHRVANAAMARALRAVSTERGVDPRELAIFAFGGNGPVHAATLARLLDLHRILVPPLPGLFSALGMLFPQTEHHYVRTHKRALDALDVAALETDFAALESDGREALAADGFAAADHRFERLVDLRYAGANSEITVPLPATATPAALCEAFAQAHERQFGYRSDEERVETMSVRVIARGARESSLAGEGLRFPEQRGRPHRTRAVYFGPEVGSLDTPVCGRGDVGMVWRAGPLLIEEFDSTTVVPPDGRVRRIGWDSLEIELG